MFIASTIFRYVRRGRGPGLRSVRAAFVLMATAFRAYCKTATNEAGRHGWRCALECAPHRGSEQNVRGGYSADREGQRQKHELTKLFVLVFLTRSSGGSWRSCCGQPLAAIGAGRRSLTSAFHRITGRLGGQGSSGANDAGSTAANVGTSAHADAEARGRLLPWGA